MTMKTMQTPSSFNLFSSEKSLETLMPVAKAQRKRLVLGCGALVYQLVELIKHNLIVDQLVEL